MDFLALLLLLVGAWLVDSGVTGRKPIETLKSILQNPSAARSTLKNAKGQGFTGAVTGIGPTVVSDSTNGVGGVSPSSGASAPMNAAVNYARAQIGKPYVWGATGPNAFDCSGLVMQAFKQAGFTLPRVTQAMVADPRLSVVKSPADLQYGDLVFPDIGHVQLYVGNGRVIEAPHTGLNVREIAMWGFWTARRVPV